MWRSLAIGLWFLVAVGLVIWAAGTVDYLL